MNSKQRRQRRRRDQRLVSDLSSVFIGGMRDSLDKAQESNFTAVELFDHLYDELATIEGLLKEIGVNCE